MHVVTGTRQVAPGQDVRLFLRHLFEMALAMMVAMLISAAVFLGAVGMTAAEAMRRHAVLFRGLASLWDDDRDGRLDAPPRSYVATISGDGCGDGHSCSSPHLPPRRRRHRRADLRG